MALLIVRLADHTIRKEPLFFFEKGERIPKIEQKTKAISIVSCALIRWIGYIIKKYVKTDILQPN